jgi:hypothetical protein
MLLQMRGRRKTLIHTLHGPNGPTSNLEEMLKIATAFYKNLFGAEPGSGFPLSDDFFSPEKKTI